MKKIKQYDFNYDTYSSRVVYHVDHGQFTEQKAALLLDVLDIEGDEEISPVELILKKYAIVIIELAVSEQLSKEGVIEAVTNVEGFIALDGSQGVKLIELETYEFDENLLDLKKTDVVWN